MGVGRQDDGVGYGTIMAMQWAKQKSGFTIVELLIVIVVIAILAAITIVAYNGIQNRAKSSAAQSTAAQAAKKLAIWQVDNAGQVPDQSTFDTIVPSGATYQYTPGTNGAYCATVTANNVSYYITESGSTPTAGGCAGHDQNGVAAITNLVVNPSIETAVSYYSVSGGGGGGAATGARVTSGGLYGPGFYRATWSAAQTVSGSAYIQNSGGGTNDATPGKTYFFRASARSNWASTLRLNIIWWNASNATISSVVSTGAAMTTNQWGNLTTSGVAPAGTARVRFLVESIGTFPVVGSTLDVDGLLMAEGEGPYGYADGSSPNWVWTSTAHASTSKGQPL